MLDSMKREQQELQGRVRIDTCKGGGCWLLLDSPVVLPPIRAIPNKQNSMIQLRILTASTQNRMRGRTKHTPLVKLKSDRRVKRDRERARRYELVSDGGGVIPDAAQSLSCATLPSADLQSPLGPCPSVVEVLQKRSE